MNNEPIVIEYNVYEWVIQKRSGDPRLKWFSRIVLAVANEKLDEITLEVDERAQQLLLCL
jgi:phosphoribosylamine--glycine ligase